MPKLPDTAGDTTILSDIGGQFLPLNYTGETLCLENCFNQFTWVSGWYDAVGYYAGGEQTLRDNGAGTMIVANGAVHLTVLNFQSDPIAKVVLANETRAPILWNDGNGGSVLSTWSGGIIHFVGEVVPASQIVSSVQPVMAFTAAAAPSPAPDPPPPAAPADPPPTVHNVTDTAYFQGSGVLNGQPPTANDGDTFHLPANNVSLTLAGLANTMTFVTGSGDQVYESYPTGPATITDNGSGLTLTINEPVGSPTMQHMISVIGFGTDLTATLRVDTGNWWTGLPPTIAPDGNGGSIIGGFVDLVGIATPNLAQLQAYRAYA